MNPLLQINPSVSVAQQRALHAGPSFYAEEPAGGSGSGWDTATDRINDSLGILNSVLCTLDPDRPGCSPGYPAGSVPQPVATPSWVYVLIGVLVLVVIVVLLKK